MNAAAEAQRPGVLAASVTSPKWSTPFVRQCGTVTRWRSSPAAHATPQTRELRVKAGRFLRRPCRGGLPRRQRKRSERRFAPEDPVDQENSHNHAHGAHPDVFSRAFEIGVIRLAVRENP